MDRIELLQKIGNEVCEGCGPDRDCGEEPSECCRIINAIAVLDEFLAEMDDKGGGAVGDVLKGLLIMPRY